MKQVSMMIAVLLLASPVFAQEIDLGLGGDVSSLLNIAAPPLLLCAAVAGQVKITPA